MPSEQFFWLPYLGRGLMASNLWWYHRPGYMMRQFVRDQSIPATCDTRLDLIDYSLEEMITLIGRRSMLFMWRSGMSGDSTLGMAFFYIRRIYHHPEMITLDGIGISREGVEGLPSSPTRYTSVMRKVQTIIRQCMVSIGGTLGCTPSQHDIQQTFVLQPLRCHPWEPVHERGARGVKRGDHRLQGGGAREGRTPAPLHPDRWGHIDPGSYVPHDPFNSPGRDTLTFSLGLTLVAPSHRDLVQN
ncbi:hypothetical protein M9H77_31538 [Catharanthus roseus]|uniref:Uncharacterized protein n=1 Tax=Catharanthus roseus TaxID=4058 RepID=A0ACC0A1B5_CATRO|nr:hypothetical protein M9H77_31538 [Catharanthus roseus]